MSEYSYIPTPSDPPAMIQFPEELSRMARPGDILRIVRKDDRTVLFELVTPTVPSFWSHVRAQFMAGWRGFWR